MKNFFFRSDQVMHDAFKEKNKIISREFSALTLLAMPSNVINIINEIALEDIRDVRMDSTTVDFKM